MKTVLEQISDEYEKAKKEYHAILSRHHLITELLIVETKVNTWSKALHIIQNYKPCPCYQLNTICDDCFKKCL